MRKLSGLDAGFLYNETASCPQHVASVQIMELPEGVSFEAFVNDLKQLLHSRAHLVPYLTHRLVDTPFAVDHPLWVQDPEFNVDNHVSCLQVPAPGGRSEWESAVARLHEQPLDRSLPLWRLVVLTGLENGHIALYNAVHHACTDGIGGQAAVSALMDTGPVPRQVPEASPRVRQTCSPAYVASVAWDNLCKAQVRQSYRWPQQLESGLRLQRRLLDPNGGLGALVETAPHTRYNRSISGRRAYWSGELSLRAAKQIAKAAGCSLNDVFLAVCGGGIRRHLSGTDELPADSLIAGCPTLLRHPRDRSAHNQLAMMQVTLATDDADANRRLMRIAMSSKKARAVTADLAGLIDGNPVYPGLPWLMRSTARFAESHHLADGAEVPFNLVISNVPGPRQPLYFAGARMLTHYPMSIPVHGMGVNITVQSYCDTLFFGITACADLLPDGHALRDGMLEEFCVLLSGIAPRAAAAAPAAVRSDPSPQTAAHSSTVEPAGSGAPAQSQAA